MNKIVYWKAMPTKMPMVSFAVDDELMRRLDDFRFENRINTRSEAIRRLLDDSLKRYEEKKEACLKQSRGIRSLLPEL